MKEPEIENCVTRYLDGDNTAFSAIKDYLSPVLTRVINSKKLLRTHSAVEDIEQECWIDLIENLHTWNPKKGNLKGYVYRCFSNRAIDYVYKENRYKTNSVSVEEHPIELKNNHQLHIQEDLLIKLRSRFSSPKQQYIIQKVCLAVFLKIFDFQKNRIISEIKEVTHWPNSRVRFYVDYTLVLIRKSYLEDFIEI